MTDEPFESRVSTLLTTAQPPLRAGWEGRAVSAMVEAKPARRRFTRRTAIAFALGVGALVALGFVPVPLGKTKGVLARAAAAVEEAPNLYIVTHSRTRDGKEAVDRVWETAEGLLRDEHWENGSLVEVWLQAPKTWVNYRANEHAMDVDDLPPLLGESGPLYGSAAYIDWLKALWNEGHSQGRVVEWKERSLWHGETDVAEIAYPDNTKTRFEIDPQSGLPISRQGYIKENGQWKLVSQTDEIEWNVDLPADIWTFAPPPGTKVKKVTFWAGRAEHPIAEGSTDAWNVRVFALEVDPQGNLHVVIYVGPTSQHSHDALAQEAHASFVEAVDNLGVRYSLRPVMGYARGYLALTLLRPMTLAPVGAARTVTLTVHPRATEQESVTFPDLPLPTPTADAGQAKTEVIQY